MDKLIRTLSTASTNADAYSLALKGAKHGVAVMADTQLGGRGRLGRKWVSPTGSGLYCSIIVRPNLPFTEYPKLTLTAGLALCLVVENLSPFVPFGLKWPNDLYCLGKKCGGILAESSPLNSDTPPFVVVGIGLNVNTRMQEFPEEIRQRATSLLIETERRHEILPLFHAIRDSLLEQLSLHEQQGFSVILEEWRKRDILLGKEMQWVTKEKSVVTGIGLGPDENGQLLVRDRSGRCHEILSGDVELAQK